MSSPLPPLDPAHAPAAAAALSVHRRLNPLTGRWVLVSPQRTQRPWQGATGNSDRPPALAHDPACYLCAGNLRANGQRNPAYTGTHVFTNDFAALQPGAAAPPGAPAAAAADNDALFQQQPAAGECKVLCFSPHHSQTLPELPVAARRAVVEAWCTLSADLGQRWRWVQVFENKGEMMGCSNPHPHGQVWASAHLPDEAASEDTHQRHWLAGHGQALLDAVLARELQDGQRTVCANADWLAVVPWWATWPFETLVLPRRPWQRLEQTDGPARDGLAALVGELTARYDGLFECSFPYSMGWHGAPHDGRDAPHWRVHAHFYPPLLRSATVRKFMVGYELLAEAQRDLTPEAAAAALRAVAWQAAP